MHVRWSLMHLSGVVNGDACIDAVVASCAIQELWVQLPVFCVRVMFSYKYEYILLPNCKRVSCSARMFVDVSGEQPGAI